MQYVVYYVMSRLQDYVALGIQYRFSYINKTKAHNKTSVIMDSLTQVRQKNVTTAHNRQNTN